MNKTRNSLDPAVRRKAVASLNVVVADLFDLFARIKQAHWNVRGTSFIGLHKLLDEFAAATIDHIDEVAERATALGGLVQGTLRESARNSSLRKREEPLSGSGQNSWIHELADVHAACGTLVRKTVATLTQAEDFGSADLLTGVLRELDKQLWLLEAHIQLQKNSH